MKHFRNLVLAVTLISCIHLAAGLAQPAQVIRFDGDDLSGWQIAGPVELDATKNRPDSAGAALKLSPGASATWTLRDTDGSGTVEMWVFDDRTTPDNPKDRRAGPRWGLVQRDGRVLVMGVLYAPYLTGDETYATSETPDRKAWLASVQYSALKRAEGWQKWTFRFDARDGLSIARNDEKRARFNWNTTKMLGFNGIALFGDEKAEQGQTLWVDDVTVELGEAMVSRPIPPPPPPPVVPENDPALDGAPAPLNAAVMSAHPRLLFSPTDLPRLRQFYTSEAARPFRASFEKLLPAAKPPAKPGFLTDATDGQRHGLWYMPTLAVHYAMTGDRRSFDAGVAYLRFLNDLPHWETGKEVDSGMSAGNIMIGAALLFDVLHDELPADLRESFRRKLFYHARAMYHGGHLGKAQKIHYWQNDPQNNHRWHRDAGMAFAALTASAGAPEEQWLLRQIYDELEFVNRWLPADGTSHESITYLIFGTSHLTLANHAADRCFGTEYLKGPFFQNVAPFLIQGIAPGFRTPFQYGDSSGLGYYGMFAFKTVADHRQPDVLAALQELMMTSPSMFAYHWMTLLWYDPTLAPGSVENLPTSSFYPDLGLAFLRDGWTSASVGAMFKCGPLGGYRLNAFRAEPIDADDNGTNDDDGDDDDVRDRDTTGKSLRYINVAHDDPDANSFIVWSNGGFVAETDRYSRHKRSANHNTILVNGLGQMVPGQPEGRVFAQPASSAHDMTDMAVVTAYKDAGDVVIVEGEAAGAYLAYTEKKSGLSRPALDRFRRTFVWVRGAYVLVLDDIRAPEPVELTWLMQAPRLERRDEPGLVFDLRHDGASCPMRIVSIGPAELEPTIGTSPADDKNKPLNWQQLQLRSTTPTLRLATVLGAWGGDVTIDVTTRDADGAVEIEVTRNGATDHWQWTPADGNGGEDRFRPSTLTAQRADGSTLGIDARDLTPKPD